MQTIAEIHLEAPAGIERLKALRHRAKTYCSREYRAHGASSEDVLLRVEGPRAPLRAWITSPALSSTSAMASAMKRRTLPPSYVDFSSLRVVSSGPTRDILITNKLLIRVDEHTGRVVAHVDVGDDLEHQIEMLNDACHAAGMPRVQSDRAEKVRELSSRV